MSDPSLDLVILPQTFDPSEIKIYKLSPTSESTGSITFTSDNNKVAEITGTNGDSIKICSTGICQIQAKQARDGDYAEASVTVTLIINPFNPPSIGEFSIPQQSFYESDEAIIFKLTCPESNSLGTFTFSSSDPNVATINLDTITIIGIGRCTITATQASYEPTLDSNESSYSTASVLAPLTVIALNIPHIGDFVIPPQGFRPGGINVFTLTSPVSDSLGTFTFSSSDDINIKIEGNLIKMYNIGLYSITATQASHGDYSSASVTATLQVRRLLSTSTQGIQPDAVEFTSAPRGVLSSTDTGNMIIFPLTTKLDATQTYGSQQLILTGGFGTFDGGYTLDGTKSIGMSGKSGFNNAVAPFSISYWFQVHDEKQFSPLFYAAKPGTDLPSVILVYLFNGKVNLGLNKVIAKNVPTINTQLGVWYYFTLTVEGSGVGVGQTYQDFKCSVYFDGIPLLIETHRAEGTSDWNIGNKQSMGGFKGKIRNLRVTNKVLSHQTIVQIYLAERPFSNFSQLFDYTNQDSPRIPIVPSTGSNGFDVTRGYFYKRDNWTSLNTTVDEIVNAFNWNSQVPLTEVDEIDQYNDAKIVMLVSSKSNRLVQTRVNLALQISSKDTFVVSGYPSDLTQYLNVTRVEILDKHDATFRVPCVFTPKYYSNDLSQQNSFRSFNESVNMKTRKVNRNNSAGNYYICQLELDGNYVHHMHLDGTTHNKFHFLNLEPKSKGDWALNFENVAAFGVEQGFVTSMYMTHNKNFLTEKTSANLELGAGMTNELFKRCYAEQQPQWGDQLSLRCNNESQPDTHRQETNISICVLEPTSYMKLYFCLTKSDNYMAQVFACCQMYSKITGTLIKDTKWGLSQERIAQVCVDANLRDGIALTTTALDMLSSTLPLVYSKLSIDERAAIILCLLKYRSEKFNQIFIKIVTALWVEPLSKQESPNSFIDLYPEFGCYMPDTFMNNYRDSLKINKLDFRRNCQYFPCYRDSVQVKDASGNNIYFPRVPPPEECKVINNIVNCYSNVTVTSSGTIGGNQDTSVRQYCGIEKTGGTTGEESTAGGGGTGGGGDTGGGGGTAPESNQSTVIWIVVAAVGLITFIILCVYASRRGNLKSKTTNQLLVANKKN